MKKSMNQALSYVLILAIGMMMTLTSCETTPDPLVIPPMDSFIIDGNQLPANNKKSTDTTSINFLHSWATVTIWNAVLVTQVAIPVVAYAAALNQTPVYLGDYTWEWSYDVTVGQYGYHASLIGERLDNETYTMEMFLTRADSAFVDFSWFDGVVRYDQTVVDWTLRKDTTNNADYLGIHFEKDFETEVSSIRYSVLNLTAEDEFYDAYIEYGLDPDFDLDAYYTIYKTSNTTNIEWSTSDKSGRVMNPVAFQDELWHCWDTTFQDVDCGL